MIKMLIVDDEEGICKFLKKIFENVGFKVSATTSAYGSLSLIDKERPQIVLLDIIMPDVSGLEVLKRIKENDKSIKVIMLTVAGGKETKEKAAQLGADYFIRKPFSENFLKEVIVEKIKELLSSESKREQ